jgi:hypothetical protein
VTTWPGGDLPEIVTGIAIEIPIEIPIERR